jgi:hypothetical protein
MGSTALLFEGNNQQHSVPARFAELRELQKKNKKELRVILIQEYYHLLPEELWDIILQMVYCDDPRAYFTFIRKDDIYNNDHYCFEGTAIECSMALAHMRSFVNPFDTQDDIPTDTYCSGLCEMLQMPCPDEHGNQCACRWNHRVFKTQDHFTRYSAIWDMPGNSFNSYSFGKTGKLKALSYIKGNRGSP